jgi:hypothetical protein
VVEAAMAAELELDPEQVVLRVTLALPPAVQVLPRAQLLAAKEMVRGTVQALVERHLARVRAQLPTEQQEQLPALELVQLVEGAL